ncbi:hypothetical protein QCA50_009513 [Cerrena zonata]|uniref:Glutaredoxin domain-containing protein n=1 Tax=Cerrena zonata TaxID=2478898 RepID=A0AAW0G5R2_9APHY
MKPTSSSPRPASPFRRRRILWTITLLTAGVFFYLFNYSETFSWSLPSSLKDASGQRRIRVQEIHGLLHFVTSYPDKRLDEDDGSIQVAGLGTVKVDPSETVDLRVFTPDGDDNWENHLKTLRTKYPLVVFSKTYCPYSRRAKALLESYQIKPAPFVVEIDTRSDGPIIQKLLGRLTGRSTVPNVLVKAQSIGGSDDVHSLHDKNTLKDLLLESGLEVHGI